MSPITHLLVSWNLANTASLSRQERAFVTIAGVVPDVDSLGIIPDFFTRNSDYPLEWWGQYHHVLSHNLGFALFAVFIVFKISTRRWLTATLSFISFHLHLIGDLVGARGPDGYQWPIPYLLPFSDTWQLTWDGQWALNAWPNFIITAVFLATTIYLAWVRGFSLLGLVSDKADKSFVIALRHRFGNP